MFPLQNLARKGLKLNCRGRTGMYGATNCTVKNGHPASLLCMKNNISKLTSNIHLWGLW